MFQWKELRYQKTTCYLKNRWTKDRLVYTHFDAFVMLIPNMGTILYNSVKVSEKKGSVDCNKRLCG